MYKYIIIINLYISIIMNDVNKEYSERKNLLLTTNKFAYLTNILHLLQIIFVANTKRIHICYTCK